jgi:hypothetical protein
MPPSWPAGSGPAGLLESAYQAAGPVLVRGAGDRDRTGMAAWKTALLYSSWLVSGRPGL